MTEHEPNSNENISGASSFDYAAAYKEMHPDAVEDPVKAAHMAEAAKRDMNIVLNNKKDAAGEKRRANWMHQDRLQHPGKYEDARNGETPEWHDDAVKYFDNKAYYAQGDADVKMSVAGRLYDEGIDFKTRKLIEENPNIGQPYVSPEMQQLQHVHPAEIIKAVLENPKRLTNKRDRIPKEALDQAIQWLNRIQEAEESQDQE